MVIDSIAHFSRGRFEKIEKNHCKFPERGGNYTIPSNIFFMYDLKNHVGTCNKFIFIKKSIIVQTTLNA